VLRTPEPKTTQINTNIGEIGMSYNTKTVVRKMKELIDVLGGLGINYYGDEARILVQVVIKSVSLGSIPTITLIHEDAEIKIEDLLIVKRMTITKAGYRKEVLLGKNMQVRFDSPYLFIEDKPEMTG
jgi:hypothetical protein